MYGKANSGANLSNLGNSPGILGIFGTSHFWTNQYFELLIGCVCIPIYIYVCMLCISVYTVYIHIYIFIYRDIPGNKLLLCLLRPRVISYFYSLSDRAVDEDAALVRVLGNLMSSHPQVAWDPVVNGWFLAIKWPEILGTKR